MPPHIVRPRFHSRQRCNINGVSGSYNDLARNLPISELEYFCIRHKHVSHSHRVLNVVIWSDNSSAQNNSCYVLYNHLWPRCARKYSICCRQSSCCTKLCSGSWPGWSWPCCCPWSPCGCIKPPPVGWADVGGSIVVPGPDCSANNCRCSCCAW